MCWAGGVMVHDPAAIGAGTPPLFGMTCVNGVRTKPVAICADVTAVIATAPPPPRTTWPTEALEKTPADARSVTVFDNTGLAEAPDPAPVGSVMTSRGLRYFVPCWPARN